MDEVSTESQRKRKHTGPQEGNQADETSKASDTSELKEGHEHKNRPSGPNYRRPPVSNLFQMLRARQMGPLPSTLPELREGPSALARDALWVLLSIHSAHTDDIIKNPLSKDIDYFFDSDDLLLLEAIQETLVSKFYDLEAIHGMLVSKFFDLASEHRHKQSKKNPNINDPITNPPLKNPQDTFNEFKSTSNLILALLHRLKEDVANTNSGSPFDSRWKESLIEIYPEFLAASKAGHLGAHDVVALLQFSGFAPDPFELDQIEEQALLTEKFLMARAHADSSPSPFYKSPVLGLIKYYKSSKVFFDELLKDENFIPNQNQLNQIQEFLRTNLFWNPFYKKEAIYEIPFPFSDPGIMAACLVRNGRGNATYQAFENYYEHINSQAKISKDGTTDRNSSQNFFVLLNILNVTLESLFQEIRQLKESPKWKKPFLELMDLHLKTIERAPNNLEKSSEWINNQLHPKVLYDFYRMGYFDQHSFSIRDGEPPSDDLVIDGDGNAFVFFRTPDPIRAMKYLKKAATLPKEWAIFRLALAHASGIHDPEFLEKVADHNLDNEEASLETFIKHYKDFKNSIHTALPDIRLAFDLILNADPLISCAHEGWPHLIRKLAVLYVLALDFDNPEAIWQVDHNLFPNKGSTFDINDIRDALETLLDFDHRFSTRHTQRQTRVMTTISLTPLHRDESTHELSPTDAMRPHLSKLE